MNHRLVLLDDKTLLLATAQPLTQEQGLEIQQAFETHLPGYHVVIMSDTAVLDASRRRVPVGLGGPAQHPAQLAGGGDR